MPENNWDAVFEVRYSKGGKITIPKVVVDRLGLSPGNYLKVAIKRLDSYLDRGVESGEGGGREG